MDPFAVAPNRSGERGDASGRRAMDVAEQCQSARSRCASHCLEDIDREVALLHGLAMPTRYTAYSMKCPREQMQAYISPMGLIKKSTFLHEA